MHLNDFLDFTQKFLLFKTPDLLPQGPVLLKQQLLGHRETERQGQGSELPNQSASVIWSGLLPSQRTASVSFSLFSSGTGLLPTTEGLLPTVPMQGQVR